MQKELQLNVPTELEGPNNSKVVVTAIDANHCPGSCMYVFVLSRFPPSLQLLTFPFHRFLIEATLATTGRPGAILITGDIRAEDWWIAALKRNPVLGKYIAPMEVKSMGKEKGKGKATEAEVRAWEEEGKGGRDGVTRLECVYLDTSSVLVDEELVSKVSHVEEMSPDVRTLTFVLAVQEEACNTLVQHMAEYPSSTRFFINAWTWGYEVRFALQLVDTLFVLIPFHSCRNFSKLFTKLSALQSI